MVLPCHPIGLGLQKNQKHPNNKPLKKTIHPTRPQMNIINIMVADESSPTKKSATDYHRHKSYLNQKKKTLQNHLTHI
mgnify:CR=1 FL=1